MEMNNIDYFMNLFIQSYPMNSKRMINMKYAAQIISYDNKITSGKIKSSCFGTKHNFAPTLLSLLFLFSSGVS